MVMPNKHAWDAFQGEYHLKIEATIFSLHNKWHVYIWIGHWDPKSHPAMKPEDIWQSTFYSVPWLQIYSPTIWFSAQVSTAFFQSSIGESLLSDLEEALLEEESLEGKHSRCAPAHGTKESIDNEMHQEDEQDMVEERHEVLSAEEQEVHKPFPLLCKYGIPLNGSDMRKMLLQELCKLNDNEVIEFNHGNNKPALFLRIPKCYNKYVFNRLLKQNGNFLDKMLQFIPRGTGDTMKTAAAWVIESLFNKYKEEFVLVGIQKGKAIVPDKVMDAATSTAMLEDCNNNSMNARKLFFHLYQFFGYQIPVPEMVRSTFFEGTVYFPKCNKIQLDNKADVFFWYKEVDKLLEHQVQHIVSSQDMADVVLIDLVVGGDHGIGKFRMTLKQHKKQNPHKDTNTLTST